MRVRTVHKQSSSGCGRDPIETLACMSSLGSMSASTLAPVFRLSSSTAALYMFNCTSTSSAIFGNWARPFASQKKSPSPTCTRFHHTDAQDVDKDCMQALS